MTTTPDLGIPELAQSQANPDVTHNEALQIIQALLKGVISLGDNAPPGSPVDGDAYVLGPAPTGAWAGRANSIAVRVGSAWRFIPGNDDAGSPIAIGARHDGLAVWVQDEQQLYVWSGSPLAWSAYVPPDASQVAYAPGSPGIIAATNVQDALDELGREKVNVTGDTMTGQLNVITGAGVQIELSSTNAGTDGAQLSLYHNSVTPAVNDFIGYHLFYGNNSAGTKTLYGYELMRVIDPTAGGEDSSLEIWTIIAGTRAETLRVSALNGLSMLGGANVIIDANRIFRNRLFTVGTLPAGVQGMRTMVTDADAPVFGAAVVGGGATTVPVYYTGADWFVG